MQINTGQIELLRFYVVISTTEQWYAVMRECRTWFGTQWRTQNKVRKKLQTSRGDAITVWFEVPDAQWSTWIATKLAIEVLQEKPTKLALYNLCDV